MAQHGVGGREVPNQILTALHSRLYRLPGLCKQPLGLTANRLVLTLGREQYGVHNNGIHGRHHHPLTVVEPLQILGEARVIGGGLQAAVFVTLQNVLGDRPRLVNRHVTVI